MRIAFNCESMKVGCALMQAALGCDPGIASSFPTECWEVGNPDGMRVYDIDDAQLNVLVARAVFRSKIVT